jgi:L-alanine-DL-glutamate epimerase-like enolase superfamily enzyme
MHLYARIAGLGLRIERYDLEGLEQPVSSGFARLTTVVRLHGGGRTGVGEDVTWGDAEQLAFRAEPPELTPGHYTLESFSEGLAGIDLYSAAAPQVPEWRYYRRWAFESAALDLALRQADRSLAEALGLQPDPVRFVVSLRLGDPPSAAPLRRLLRLYPGTRFKLDPTVEWDDALITELAGTGAVETLDLKSAYQGAWGAQPPDPALYRRLAETFPEAWIEDPNLDDPATAEALEPHSNRITCDAVIHSVEDVQALRSSPRMLNSKPSRFGSLRAVLDFYDYCADHGIGLYGGGQFELGPGRGQIQALASLLHPRAPNDVAPGGYNARTPRAGLETSPLEPLLEPHGFGRLRETRRGVAFRGFVQVPAWPDRPQRALPGAPQASEETACEEAGGGCGSPPGSRRGDSSGRHLHRARTFTCAASRGSVWRARWLDVPRRLRSGGAPGCARDDGSRLYPEQAGRVHRFARVRPQRA